MISLLLLSCAHGGAGSLPDYPIDAWTLRKHIQHADLIAVAIPEATVEGPHLGCRASRSCDSTTVLRIRKVLQGEDPGKQIVVGTRQAVI